jgi:replicative DNA helicase
VIALAQVGRHVDTRPDKQPGMGDLSDSSEIEKEADQVLMIYRDEVYDPETKKKGIARIIIEKNRHGPTGYIECAFEAETMRFSDLSPIDPIWGVAAA